MKVAKLICVTSANNNKFYNMSQIDDNTFAVEYGRVDATIQKTSYPMSRWYSTYNSKIKKGYTDITDLSTEVIIEERNVFKDINDKIKNLLEFLLKSAKNKIAENYKISSQAVTEKMINQAQTIINEVSCRFINNIQNEIPFDNGDIRNINNYFIKLYEIIPRKMKNVKNHLLEFGDSVTKFKHFLENEQSLLDTLAGQVSPIKTDDNVVGDDINILDEINTTIELVENEKESDLVYGLMESNKRYVKNIYRVNNKNTENVFNPNSLKTKMLFHGSRNENMWNIIKSGLLIRPSCASHTGSMFSDGCYFANKAQKSKGYTSARGSYWAGGNSGKYFLIVYEVAVGNQKHIYKHDSSCYSITYESLQRDGFDSVYAHGGADLKNDEFIVYKTNQSTIKYLIEMEE